MDSVETVFKPSEKFRASSHVSSLEAYRKLYQDSIDNPDAFWRKIASEFYWETEPTKSASYNLDPRIGRVSINWFEGGRTNICYNLVDRHVKAGLGGRLAYIWEGNEVTHRSEV